MGSDERYSNYTVGYHKPHLKIAKKTKRTVVMPLLSFSLWWILMQIFHFFWIKHQRLVSNTDNPIICTLSGYWGSSVNSNAFPLKQGPSSISFPLKDSKYTTENLTNVKATIFFVHAWRGQMVFVLSLHSVLNSFKKWLGKIGGRSLLLHPALFLLLPPPPTPPPPDQLTRHTKMIVWANRSFCYFSEFLNSLKAQTHLQEYNMQWDKSF